MRKREVPTEPRDGRLECRVNAELKALVASHARAEGKTLADVVTEAFARYAGRRAARGRPAERAAEDEGSRG